MDKINTFWNLISEHRIEIPIIQRDYVQGRTDAKATQIRKGFVKSIIESLQNNRKLHLDFIYGKINGKLDAYKVEMNKKAILSLLRSVQDYSSNLEIGFNYTLEESKEVNKSNTYFIPLDGQQRLTTLFLFHWYLTNKLGYDHKDTLERFSYRTRRSSKDFCSALVNHKVDLELNNNISEIISDSTWFFAYWKKDPTVRSMLNMLDEIHMNLGDESDAELEKYWLEFTNNETITFEFLDLDKFELTDELYVKMNARGKVLSDFENFKSWLQSFVKKNSWNIDDNNWHKQLDIEWTDIFWSFKKTSTYSIDSQYLNFFRLMMLFQFTESVQVEKSKIDDYSKKVIDDLRSDQYLSFRFIENLNSFNEGKLNEIFRLLQILQNNSSQKVNQIIKRLITSNFPDPIKNLFSENNSKLNLWDRVNIYAIIKYLLIKDKALNDFDGNDDEQLFQWARVCRNLIYNTPIDSPSDFCQAIQQINQLAEYISTHNDFYGLFNDKAKVNTISFFSKMQIVEEEYKAELILQNPQYLEYFIKFENHNYFYGSIRFLLMLTTNDNTINIDLFNEYAAKSAALFDNKILNHSEFILHRALLTKGDYLIKVGPNKSFCLSAKGTLRLREENWRRVFNDSSRRELIKSLLDAIELGKEKESLIEIIKNSEVDSNNWRFYLIDTPKMIEYAKKMQVRFWDKNVYLLNASGSCKNVELHSYWHHIKIFNSIKPNKTEYFEVVGYGDEPYESIELKSNAAKLKVQVNRNYETSEYEMEISSKKSISTNLNNHLINEKFILNKGVYEKSVREIQSIDDVISELKKMNPI